MTERVMDDRVLRTLVRWYIMSTHDNYRDSFEVGSDPLTTKIFTREHVQLK